MFSDKKNKSGFTLIELLLVMGITVIIASVGFVNLFGKRNTEQLASATKKITAVLREAQSNSITQASSTSWGVHFQSTTTSFYALFAGSYATGTVRSWEVLPAN